ncbi:MAG TPA: hypothetical protein VMT52_16185 [Planctomycetota bacterium]|nr:hypothetical protein [Planctomycetota bacterium]
MGLEEEQSVRILVIGHKRFVVEVAAVYTPEIREDLRALARRLIGLLDDALAHPAEEVEAKTEQEKKE